eukprot:113604-Rhodomonas_salina.2
MSVLTHADATSCQYSSVPRYTSGYERHGTRHVVDVSESLDHTLGQCRTVPTSLLGQLGPYGMPVPDFAY